MRVVALVGLVCGLCVTSPVVGADKVARAVVGLIARGMQLPDVRAEMVICNAAPAVLLYAGEKLEGVFTVEIVDGKIKRFDCYPSGTVVMAQLGVLENVSAHIQH